MTWWQKILRFFGFGSNPLNVKYFGYVSTADNPDSLRVTSPFTNFAFGGCDPDIVKAATAGRVKLFVNLGPVFFEALLGGKALYPDYVDRWQAFRVSNNLDILVRSGIVLAFYLVDEPVHSGVSAADLEKVADLVKMTYQSVPTAVSESHVTIGKLVVPATVDWIGFSVYAIKTPATDKAYLGYYQILLSRRSRPGQRAIVVVDGWWDESEHGGNGISTTDMGPIADSYFAFAKAHAEVICMAVFIWPDFGVALGSASLPGAVAYHRVIGKQITGK